MESNINNLVVKSSSFGGNSAVDSHLNISTEWAAMYRIAEYLKVEFWDYKRLGSIVLPAVNSLGANELYDSAIVNLTKDLVDSWKGGLYLNKINEKQSRAFCMHQVEEIENILGSLEEEVLSMPMYRLGDGDAKGIRKLYKYLDNLYMTYLNSDFDIVGIPVSVGSWIKSDLEMHKVQIEKANKILSSSNEDLLREYSFTEEDSAKVFSIFDALMDKHKEADLESILKSVSVVYLETAAQLRAYLRIVSNMLPLISRTSVDYWRDVYLFIRNSVKK